MTPGQWERVNEVFGVARERGASEREAFVLESCADDGEVLAEVMSLLQNSSTPLPNPIAPMASRTALLKDRYRVERELDEPGGLSVVYLARDELFDGRPVVVKMPLLLGEAWPVSTFEREMKALARIDHPGVVGALDSGVATDGRRFLVMRYVEGESLRHALTPEGTQLGLERAASIAEQIGHALAAAHTSGVIHRDLKPANIMLQSLPGGIEHVCIIDFGIATIRDAQNKSTVVHTQLAGSLLYMAPEQLEGEVSVATDVYAFGVVMYEMLTGRKPFQAENQIQLQSLQKTGVPVKPSALRPELSASAERLILNALAYRPKDRPKAAGVFGEELAKALRSSAILTLTPTRRWAMVTAVAGSVGAAGLAATAWRLMHSSTPSLDLSYSILLQPTQNGVPVGFPELARLGRPMRPTDSFVLLIRTTRPGHIYVLSEEQGKDGLNTLFPAPWMYQGSSWLDASKQKRIPETTWLQFDSPSAVFVLWLVWSETPLEEIEKLRMWINERDRGAVGKEDERQHVRRILAEAAVVAPSVVGDHTEETMHVAQRRFAWKVRLETKAQQARRSDGANSCEMPRYMV
jgi:serine/threonine protein kinase